MTDFVLNLNSFPERNYYIKIFCVNKSTLQFTKLQKRYANNFNIKCYQLPLNATDNYTTDIKNCVKSIKLENEIDCFDIVLIDISEIVYDMKLSNKNFYESRFLILENINTLQGYREYEYLSSNPTYILKSQNSCLRGGYAIFKRIK
jgi:hypothetical protein